MKKERDDIMQESLKIKDKQVGIGALNPFGSNIAAARGNMGNTQASKSLAVKGIQTPIILTGHEKSMIHGLKQTSVDGEVIVLDKVVKRFNGIEICSYIFFMAEDEVIDVIEIPVYESLDNKMVFKHKRTEDYYAEPGDTIDNPVFSTTPSNKDGYNAYGIEADVVFANVNEIGEDALIVSDELMKKFAFQQTKTFTIIKGKKDIFKNIYGNDVSWKGFPDVGDKVRHDGVLYDLLDLDIENMEYHSIDSLRSDFLTTPSPIEDRAIYAKGVVTNIEVITQPKKKKQNTRLSKVDTQIDYYRDELIKHKKDLIYAYNGIQKEIGNGIYDTSLKFSPELGSLLEDAFTYHDASKLYNIKGALRGVQRVGFNKIAIDTIINITVVYTTIPGKGYKLSDLHGAKGIIGMVLPAKDMPCDCILNPLATPDRTIPGRLEESYLASLTRDVRVKALTYFKDGKVDKAINYIVGYYNIVTPALAKSLRKYNENDKVGFLKDLENSELHIRKRFQDTNFVEMYKELESSIYKKEKLVGSLKLPGIPSIDLTGKTFKGTLYTTMLNNLPTACMATDKPRVNALGLAPSTSKMVKNKYPYNVQASRILSEPESKIIVSYGDPKLIAELRDRMSTTARQLEQCTELLIKPDPANIDVLLDRKKFPFIPGIGSAIMSSIYTTGGLEQTHTKILKKER